MRIAWATPFNIHSAIATYSREVCAELTERGINVEILRIEAEESRGLEELSSPLIVHAASNPLTLDFLRDFDAIVVNIGDYSQYHLGALRLFSMLPVICIVHDADLRHFVYGAVESGYHLDDLAARLPTESDEAVDPRKLELALFATLSCACVAHGSHYVDTLEASCPGPVATLPLCYPDLGSVKPKPSHAKSFVITTFGLINSNKQPERVIRAIASSPLLKSKATYRLVGPIQDTQQLRLNSLAKELGIRPIEVYGRVDDQKLFDLLASSDVICCLRYPISEGGSASLITALYSARPVVTPDFGSYADLPDDLVWKVSYGEDIADLASALCLIEKDRVGAEQRVAAAKKWAQTAFSAKSYVNRLLPLINAAIKAAPSIEAGRSIGRMLASMDVAPGDPVVDRLDTQIKIMFAQTQLPDAT